MKNVNAVILTMYPNELVAIFIGIQNQLPEDNNAIERITALTRLNPVNCTQVNGKVNKSFPILNRLS